MNREQYQAAFSWVEPSEAALERAVEQAKPHGKERPRTGTVVLAAVLSVLLLSGGVFAASRWLTIRDTEDPQADPLKENDGSRQAAPQASSRQLLELSHPDVQTYVGFTLPEAYQSMADKTNCLSLRSLMEHDQMLSALPAGTDLDDAFSRYYGADGEGNLLTVEVLGSPSLSRDSYFTSGSFSVEKEDTENGFETAWIAYTDTQGRTSWHIFCHSEESDCVVIASSTKSFAEADQAVRDLRLVDTRIPLDKHQNDFYALRQPELGKGWETLLSISVAPELTDAKLEDPETDLDLLYKQVQLAKKADNVYISVYIFHGKHAPVSPGETVMREMECGGLPAALIEGDGSPFLRLSSPEENYWIELHSFQTEPDEEILIPLLEEAVSKLEVVRIGVTELAPFEFSPFSVG